jgi:acyl dehydratase
MTTRFFEDVQIGEELPAFVRQTDLMHWNRFAAVNDEFAYIHMDDEAGHGAGLDGAIGMGNLRWAYVLNALRAWAGDEAEIREMSMQFRAINNKNDVLRTSARVVDKTQAGADNLVVVEVNVLNQKDETTSPGRAVIVLPSRP